MKIVFWGKGGRGVSCLSALLADRQKIIAVVVHPEAATKAGGCSVAAVARAKGIPVLAPPEPNGAAFEKELHKLHADLFVLGGYGNILKKNIWGMPRLGTVNLHGGKLPAFRGSSPLNWALLSGEKRFTLSVIAVDSGVDTGDVYLDKEFPIRPDSTIAELHAVAEKEFPRMLLQVVKGLAKGKPKRRKQKTLGRYFPLRFPSDGLVVWDQQTAQEIHNQIRALTDPYPNAFSYFAGKRVDLLKSRLAKTDFRGEPGRIYQVSGDNGLLVCAKDRCLWLSGAVFHDGRNDFLPHAKRYESFSTVRNTLLSVLEGR